MTVALITSGLLCSGVIWVVGDIRMSAGLDASEIFSTVTAGLTGQSANQAPARLSAPPLSLSPVVHESIYDSASFFDKAYAAAPKDLLGAGEASGVTSIIVPHHLFVRERIAAMFRSLEGRDFDTVVIVSPDHFGRGHGRAVLSTARWNTPYGFLEPDLEVAGELVAAGAMRDESPFGGEHGVSGLVAFVKKSQPTAKLMPLLLRGDVTAEQILSISEVLSRASESRRLLVVGSVDFSHEVDAATAWAWDVESVNAIGSLDFAQMRKCKLDSPATIEVVARYAESVGVGVVRVVSSTHTGQLLGRPEEIGTSHQIVVFERQRRKS